MQERNHAQPFPIHQEAVLHPVNRVIRRYPDLGQVVAHGKGIIPQAGHGIRQLQSGQAFAVGKGTVSDALQRGGKRHGLHGVTGTEGFVADDPDSLRNHHARQTELMLKSAVTDFGHRIIIQLSRNLQDDRAAVRLIVVFNDPGRLILQNLIFKQSGALRLRRRMRQQQGKHSQDQDQHQAPLLHGLCLPSTEVRISGISIQ